MKELQILESWADTIIAERVQDRPVERGSDIQYQASLKYPDRSPEQALQLYVANKMSDNDKMNLEQNKLINAQKRENEKLTRSVQELGQELTDHERQAQDTGREIERLKQLSAQLGPAGQEQQTLAKASADKVEAMLKDLQSLENKPGVDDKKYQELVNKINKIKSQPADDATIQKVQTALALLNQRQNVDDTLFNKVMDKLENTERELEAKEQRFRKSLSKNAQKIGDWGNKFKDLDEKIKDIQSTSEVIFQDLGSKQEQAEEMYTQSWATMKKTRQLLNDLEETKDEQQDMIDRLFDLVSRLNPETQKAVGGNVERLKSLSTDVKDKEDKEEADYAKVLPAPITGDDLENAVNSTAANDQNLITQPTKSEEELAQDLANKLKGNTIKFPSRDERDAMRTKKVSEDLGKKYEEVPPPVTQPQQAADWTSEELENGIVEMMDLYRRRYPADFKEYPADVIRKVIRKSIGGSLLIYGDDMTPQHIFKYLDRVQRILHKTNQPTQPELPGIPRTNPNLSTNDRFGINESLLKSYEKQLTKLSNGW